MRPSAGSIGIGRLLISVRPPNISLALAIVGVSQPARSAIHWAIVATAEKAIQAKR
jgi:hypothetical protein